MKIKTFTHYFMFLSALMMLSLAINAQTSTRTGYGIAEDVLPVVASPGFEEDTVFNVWEDWDNSSINEEASYVKSGIRSLKISPDGGGAGQLMSDFTPETEISLFGWAITDGELTSEAYIGIYADDDEFKSEVSAVSPYYWTRLCVSTTIPAGTEELWVYFWYDGDENGVVNAFADDFKIVWGDACDWDVKANSSLLDPAVNVYPSPATGPVQISIGEALPGASSLEIFDVSGKLISRINELNGQKNVIADLSSAAAGLYIGVITSEGNSVTFKILKR
jgi:hypothetical protein